MVRITWTPPSLRNGSFNYMLMYSADQTPPYPHQRRQNTSLGPVMVDGGVQVIRTVTVLSLLVLLDEVIARLVIACGAVQKVYAVIQISKANSRCSYHLRLFGSLC